MWRPNDTGGNASAQVMWVPDFPLNLRLWLPRISRIYLHSSMHENVVLPLNEMGLRTKHQLLGWSRSQFTSNTSNTSNIQGKTPTLGQDQRDNPQSKRVVDFKDNHHAHAIMETQNSSTVFSIKTNMHLYPFELFFICTQLDIQLIAIGSITSHSIYLRCPLRAMVILGRMTKCFNLPAKHNV